MAFSIEVSQPAREHLSRFRKRDQRIIVNAIANQLSHQPDQTTQHRKLLDDNSLAPWELRVGDFRIFYDVDREDDLVLIVAIGQKLHNQLRIGGEEIEL